MVLFRPKMRGVRTLHLPRVLVQFDEIREKHIEQKTLIVRSAKPHPRFKTSDKNQSRYISDYRTTACVKPGNGRPHKQYEPCSVALIDQHHFALFPGEGTGIRVLWVSLRFMMLRTQTRQIDGRGDHAGMLGNSSTYTTPAYLVISPPSVFHKGRSLICLRYSPIRC